MSSSEYCQLINKFNGSMADATVNFVILGAGGIGGNIIKTIRDTDVYRCSIIVAIDDDTLSTSNLNRLHYPIDMLGLKKCDVQLNFEKWHKFYLRSHANVNSQISDEFSLLPLDGRVGTEAEFLSAMARVFECEDLINAEVWTEFASIFKFVVIDCRDTAEPSLIFDEIDIKCTYNGGNEICVELNPAVSAAQTISLDGPSNHYEITPSFCIPPLIITNFCLALVTTIPFEIYATMGRSLATSYRIHQKINEILDPFTEEI